METMTPALDIDTAYPLTPDQIAFFRAKGFVRLKDALSPAVIAHYGEHITEQVIALNTMRVPLAQRSTYDKAFLQISNIWEKDDGVRAFVFGRRLARAAAELLGSRGVRMYHDQALYKEAGGGFTPWHADQQYWPLQTAQCCTAWIPLQATAADMGPLAFAAGSHTFTFGRDLVISDESERLIQAAVEQEDFEIVDDPFALGEVSFHYGWTLHRAGPNTTDQPRRVMTIIYMDVDMRLAPPANINQQRDWQRWCPGATLGEIIDSPLNPVLFEA